MKNYLAIIALSVAITASAEISDLRVNHLTSPLGIDDPAPRFSWVTDRDGVVGGSIVVLDANGLSVADIPVDPQAVPLVKLSGAGLKPFSRYDWTVTLRYADGSIEQSAPASFETGMMTEGNWRGNWISDSQDPARREAPYFRKSFSLEKPVKSARAYISVAGLYNLTVNGRPVTETFLNPVYTRFDRRLSYNTYDVTDLLTSGENVIGVILGNGWYNHQALGVWDFHTAPWRNRPVFCMDLRVEYADGTSETIITDETWRTSDGAWRYNNIYTGEHYDFRAEKHGWSLPGYDDSAWAPVIFRPAPSLTISAQQMVPIRLCESLEPVSVTTISPTCLLYDFGKNMAGITELTANGPAGARIILRHGERLHDDGTLDQSNIDVYYRGDRDAEPFQTDIVTLDGRRDTFRPEFSYKGFRYVQVDLSEPIPADSLKLTAHFIHSDVDPVGNITSSNPLLQQILDATMRAYLSNLTGYPTDCPQREKNGWTGDGHLAIEVGLFNFDGISVYEKWMRDHRDEQQPNGTLPDIIPTCGWGYRTDYDNGLSWSSTIAIIPWELYLFYGDKQILADCYDNIRRYVKHVDDNHPDHLTSWGRFDWVPVKSTSDNTLTSSIYFYADTRILADAARLLGYEDDARYYSDLADKIRSAINSRFLDAATGIYASGTQTEQSMALFWGLVPDDLKPAAAAHLAQSVIDADYHIDCGILGTKALLHALADNGYPGIAYRVAVQDTYPSWGNWIKNGQATTLVENWDLDATRDISDNHIMFAEIGAWPYRGLAGIAPDPAAPGFKHIILRPAIIPDLKQFSATHRAPNGDILSGWTIKGRKYTYTATIPANSSATLYLPDHDEPIDLGAGTHTFTGKIR